MARNGKEYFVYLTMNNRNTVIYTGVTNDLAKRMEEHKQKADPKSFSAKYNVDKLVYYEVFDNVYEAISREKQIKGWTRKKKLKLIKSLNPEFKDLSNEL